MDAALEINLATERPFALGDFRVDPAALRFDRGGPHDRQLPPRVMKLLVALYQADGEVVGRDALNRRCWGGQHLGRDAIERAIGTLRRLAEEAGPRGFAVETIPRVGYRLRAADSADEAPRSAVPLVPHAEPAPPPPPERGISRRQAIAASVIAGAVVAGGVAIGTRFAWHDKEPVRLAVIPFDDLSPSGGGGFLAAGISRELRDMLSRVDGLRVIAESSSLFDGDQALTDKAIGARLDAGLLVRGSVREAGGMLRLTTELIDARDGTILWSGTQAGRADQLFAIQDAATGAILRELVARIGSGDALPQLRPRNATAYRLVLEARDNLERGRRARMDGDEAHGLDLGDRAMALAGQALAVDAGDVGALMIQAELTRNGWTHALAAQPASGEARVDASIAIVSRALKIDPNNPEALTALGDYYRRFLWRWDDAEKLFRKALAINPSLVEAHWSYGYQLGVLGRGLEGLAHARILTRLDPASTWRRVAMPRLLLIVGRKEQTLEEYAGALRASPGNLFLILEIYIVLLTLYDANGLRGLASQVRGLARAPLKPDLARLLDRIGHAADAIEGRPDALLAMVDADLAAFDAPAAAGVASRQGRLSIDYLYIYGIEYAWCGRVDPAIRAIGRALASRTIYWPTTAPHGIAPFPPATRNDPRFVALWRSTPQLARLVAQRADEAAAGQMAGTDGSGKARMVPDDAVARSLRAA